MLSVKAGPVEINGTGDIQGEFGDKFILNRFLMINNNFELQPELALKYVPNFTH